MNRYRIMNNITEEWWEGEAHSAQEAAQKAGWPIGHCWVRVKIGEVWDYPRAEAEAIAKALEEEHITEVIQDLISKYNKTPAEINAGLCEEFAEDVIKQMGGHSEDITDMAMPIESKYFGHVWIKYKGKHYDALHPYGVENWKDLFETEKTKDHRFGE